MVATTSFICPSNIKVPIIIIIIVFYYIPYYVNHINAWATYHFFSDT